MKKRILTIIAVVALAVVMVVGLVACAGKKEVSGFDIDLAKAIFEKEGIEVVTRKIDWSQKEIELNSGKIDLVWTPWSGRRRMRPCTTGSRSCRKSLSRTLAGSFWRSRTSPPTEGVRPSAVPCIRRSTSLPGACCGIFI